MNDPLNKGVDSLKAGKHTPGTERRCRGSPEDDHSEPGRFAGSDQ